MKLEHKHQQLLPFRQFLMRMLRFFSFALLVILFSVGIGLFGYHFIAQLNWVDSFHMACMILTGMGPVADMKSDTAKLFSSFYALYSGVAFLSIIAVLFTPIVHRILHILHIEDK